MSTRFAATIPAGETNRSRGVAHFERIHRHQRDGLKADAYGQIASAQHPQSPTDFTEGDQHGDLARRAFSDDAGDDLSVARKRIECFEQRASIRRISAYP
jgi:hypothetical protein